ncbi:MAG: diguanylate cyclase [Sulfurimicrobium sp.]|jgi:diguanylate cyclase (GGDEF)-like protein/PAS domain S-box-containing protein|nr:diguanylate cyclase [Sulfurimicrobium sp.]MDZ7657641.1 diguanylate cyclase [Sulfurimicrobium sp.]
MFPHDESPADQSSPCSPGDAQCLLRELRLLQDELNRHKHEAHKLQRQLEEMRACQAVLYDLAPVGYLTLDDKGRTLDINPTGAEILGRERSSMSGKHFIAWLAEEERPRFLSHLREAFLFRGRNAIDLRIKTPNGILRDVHLESRIMENPHRPTYCHSVLTDQSDHRKAEEASCLTARVIESAAEGIMITDAKRIIRAVNPAFVKSTGYSAKEAIGRSPALLHSGHHDKNFYKEMWAAIDTQGQWQGEVWNRHKSGEIYPEWLSISAVRDSRQKVTHYVGIFSDAHTQECILERLHYLAYYDGLTGLPNRHLFLDRLKVSLAQARRDGHMLAIMFIDLDHFKQINDSKGHKIGDCLLMAVTERLKTCLRDGDTLARLGGDEFTVILPALSHPEAALHVARKFLETYASPVNIEGHELHITGSIGISIFPADGEDAESLLNHADMAMYQIKGSGRNGYQRYHEKIGESALLQFAREMPANS